MLHGTASTTKSSFCSSNVILSGVNGNVIMSGCGDDNPDDARREANRDYSAARGMPRLDTSAIAMFGERTISSHPLAQ
jgi:hypothetical protein